jgi:hypothetical protein
MSTVRKLLRFPFWAAVALGALGCVISFYPGAEVGWFVAVAVLSLAGLFVPKAPYRVGGGLLLVPALFAAYRGYQRGVEYREYLSALGLHRDGSAMKPTTNPASAVDGGIRLQSNSDALLPRRH